MKAEELFRELKKGAIRPIYCLYGGDDYLKDEAYSRLKEEALKGGIVDFNYDLFYCGEADIARALSAASTLPVMAARRLVVLKDADKLRAHEQEALIAYVENPSETTTLVFIAAAIDRRKKLFTLIGKRGAMVEVNSPFEREMPKWIRWVANKKGVEIADEAARYLVDIVGNDLNSIANEVEKAALFAGDRKRIELGDIESVTVDIKAKTVFQLIDAIGTKNLKKSLENLKKLLDSGESPLLILNMIVRQVRLIWTGLEIMKKGGGEGEVRKRVSLPPFVFKGYLKQVRLFREDELKGAFEGFLDLDLKFKSSRINKEKALELLIFNLCGNSR